MYKLKLSTTTAKKPSTTTAEVVLGSKGGEAHHY